MSVVDAYLKRIGYAGPLKPNSTLLRSLHRAHLLAVPFENLDISLERKIICDEDAFLRKIVEHRRGAFCYELNGAFTALLSPEFDHLTLRVDLEEPWLADVGFGDCFLEPLRFAIGFEQPQGGRKYRIVDENGTLHVQRTEPDDRWKRQYSFTLTPRRLDEFAAMCHYHQTSPESPFTRKKLCTLASYGGWANHIIGSKAHHHSEWQQGRADAGLRRGVARRADGLFQGQTGSVIPRTGHRANRASASLRARSWMLLQRIQARAQAGLVARGGVLMQHTFLDSLIQRGNRLTISLLGA
jgi:N-hydroxyarylamine O-acetyltransferase